MKINEIFDTERSSSTINDFSSFKSYNDKEIGRGSFSRVLDVPEDPHIVDKEQMTTISDTHIDLFDAYAEIISNEKLWNMVHFPRIYKIKKYTDSDNVLQHKWEMEKLIPINSPDISKTEYFSLIERYFFDDHIDDLRNASNSSIAWRISDKIEYGIPDNSFKDDTLVKASKKLNEIYHKLQNDYGDDYDVIMDIHSENIMFRRTHLGLDLVFSDPFAIMI